MVVVLTVGGPSGWYVGFANSDASICPPAATIPGWLGMKIPGESRMTLLSILSCPPFSAQLECDLGGGTAGTAGHDDSELDAGREHDCLPGRVRLDGLARRERRACGHGNDAVHDDADLAAAGAVVHRDADSSEARAAVCATVVAAF